MLTCRHTMDFDKVWRFDGFQRLARMPPLTSAFAPGSFSQTFRARCSLFVSVTGRRLPAVAAVLGKLVFQVLYALGQLAKRLEEKLHDRFFAFTKSRSYFCFVWYVASGSMTNIVLGFYVFEEKKVKYQPAMQTILLKVDRLISHQDHG